MRRWILITAALALAVAACTDSTKDFGAASVGAVELGSPAPEFPGSLDWVNPVGSLRFDRFRGRVTLIHFWRSSCLGCLEAMSEIEDLGAEFGDDLVVVGVHSPKFPHEADSDTVRNTLLQQQFSGLVVDDSDRQIWNDWGIQAWPSAAVVDHEGNLAAGHIGLGAVTSLRPLIEELIANSPQQGGSAAASAGLPLAAPTVLSFPEAVLVDEPGSRLFIADTGHHRIVVADLDSYEVMAVLGDGTSGSDDGPAATASFAMPHGMALDETGSTLFVADTGNHLIRSVDLVALEVATIAGTGERGMPLTDDGPALETALTAPWDMALAGDGLVISLAGANQLVSLDLEAATLRVVAGSGRQGTTNGQRDAAEFAAPAGLGIDDDGVVYVADSESSSIRMVSADGWVGHLAGGAENLFDFGDEDGSGASARLQYPLGVAVGADAVWVADTYNSKIKRVAPGTGEVGTLVGGEGWRDGPAPLFSAPVDVELAGRLLYVADRDNHSVRVVDSASGATSTVILEGIERLVPDDEVFSGTLVAVDPVEVAPGPGTVTLNVTYPAGYKANDLAPSRFEWIAEGDVVTMPADVEVSVAGPTFPMQFDFTFAAGEGSLRADLWLVYCESTTESICLFDRARIDIPLQASAGGQSDVRLAYEVVLPDGL